MNQYDIVKDKREEYFTVEEIISRFDEEYPNPMDAAVKIRRLKDIERLIQREVIMTHVLPFDFDKAAHFIDWGEQSEMYVYAPYEDVYIYYMASRDAMSKNDTKRYTTYQTMYNNALITFQAAYNRVHMPIRSYPSDRENLRQAFADQIEAVKKAGEKEIEEIDAKSESYATKEEVNSANAQQDRRLEALDEGLFLQNADISRTKARVEYLETAKKVSSVNGMSGDVLVTLGSLDSDTDHRTVTDGEKDRWNGMSSYDGLTDRPAINGITLTGDMTLDALGGVQRHQFDAAVGSLSGRIDTETEERKTAVTAEASTRLAQDAEEKRLREAADTAEAQDRAQADADEAQARAQADTALGVRIDGKQDKLTAGANITIRDNVISSTGGGGGTDYTGKCRIIGVGCEAYGKDADGNKVDYIEWMDISKKYENLNKNLYIDTSAMYGDGYLLLIDGNPYTYYESVGSGEKSEVIRVYGSDFITVEMVKIPIDDVISKYGHKIDDHFAYKFTGFKEGKYSIYSLIDHLNDRISANKVYGCLVLMNIDNPYNIPELTVDDIGRTFESSTVTGSLSSSATHAYHNNLVVSSDFGKSTILRPYTKVEDGDGNVVDIVYGKQRVYEPDLPEGVILRHEEHGAYVLYDALNESKQDKLTAGANITIRDNVISSSGGGGEDSRLTKMMADGGVGYITNGDSVTLDMNPSTNPNVKAYSLPYSGYEDKQFCFLSDSSKELVANQTYKVTYGSQTLNLTASDEADDGSPDVVGLIIDSVGGSNVVLQFVPANSPSMNTVLASVSPLFPDLTIDTSKNLFFVSFLQAGTALSVELGSDEIIHKISPEFISGGGASQFVTNILVDEDDPESYSADHDAEEIYEAIEDGKTCVFKFGGKTDESGSEFIFYASSYYYNVGAENSYYEVCTHPHIEFGDEEIYYTQAFICKENGESTVYIYEDTIPLGGNGSPVIIGLEFDFNKNDWVVPEDIDLAEICSKHKEDFTNSVRLEWNDNLFYPTRLDADDNQIWFSGNYLKQSAPFGGYQYVDSMVFIVNENGVYMYSSDNRINGLIDDKMGVIENGTY